LHEDIRSLEHTVGGTRRPANLNSGGSPDAAALLANVKKMAI
jgi:hypothetical protein